MKIGLAQNTPSQTRQTLTPCTKDCSSALSGDEIIQRLKEKKIKDKSGNDIVSVLNDMKLRQDALLICNMAADEENSPINSYLLENHSDRLTEGIKVLAKAGGCKEIIIYEPEGLNAEALTDKLKDEFKVTHVNGEDSLVLRDASALYNEIENGEIRVNKLELEFNREFLSQGINNRPTLVLDAETICLAACIAENPDANLTKLVVINTENPFIAEVKVKTKVSDVLSEFSIESQKPLLIGGVLGRFEDVNSHEDLLIDYDWKSGSITVFSGDDCMVKKTAELLEQAKNQSCQKCVMCREGSYQLSALYSGVVNGKGKREDTALIDDIAPLIMQGTICGFGENMAGLAYSSVLNNIGEIEAHIVKKTCPAGQCESFKSFYINPSLCTGCGDCMDACEYDAIEGKTKFIHVIDQKMCEKCGECMHVCPEDAVVTQKIRVPKKPMRVGTFK